MLLAGCGLVGCCAALGSLTCTLLLRPTAVDVVQVATWLDAVLYISSYRPVPLQEYIKDGRRILDHNYQV